MVAITSTRTIEPWTQHQLGRSCVLGERVPDRQSNIDIKLGPVERDRFTQLLPGCNTRNTLRDLIRGHSGLAMMLA